MMGTLIENKIVSMQKDGFKLGNRISAEHDIGNGALMSEYENATIYYHPKAGPEAYEVHGGIRAKLNELGGPFKVSESGDLLVGFPTSSQFRCEESGNQLNKFQSGAIFWLNNGVFVRNKIFQYYESLQLEKSDYKLPLLDTMYDEIGQKQFFEFGTIFIEKGTEKIVECLWTPPQLGNPRIFTQLNFYCENILKVFCKSQSFTAKESQQVTKALFDGKLFLREVGTKSDTPLFIDLINVNSIKSFNSVVTNYFEHYFSIKLAAPNSLKNNTLYDLIIKVTDSLIHTLAAHSVFIKDDWADTKIAHITDLHIARRNDYLRTLLLNANFNQGAREFNNYNDSFRQFIKFANRLHQVGKLDLIICTGDIVDYIFEDEGFYTLHNNFSYFEKIIRGLDAAPDGETAEELRVPIFTSLGNHDYRPQSYYFITETEIPFWFNYTKKFFSSVNLTEQEAGVLRKAVSTDRALAMVTPDTNNENGRLNYYFKYINRSKTYSVNIGDNKILMIDGKHDLGYPKGSWDALTVAAGNQSGELKQFVSGTPNSVGFTDEEITFVKSQIDSTKGSVIIGVHNPIINLIEGDAPYPYHLRESIRSSASLPFKAVMKKYLFRVDFVSFMNFNYASLKNSPHKNWSLKNSSEFAIGNGDDLLDCGIMRNLKFEFLKVCAGAEASKKVNLVLSGHVHYNWECRVKYDETTKQFKFYTDFYTENPSKYYFDIDLDVDVESGGVYQTYPKSKENKFEVIVTKDSGTPPKIIKRQDGLFELQTFPNPDTLNEAKEVTKIDWWKRNSPLFIQTEPIGPMQNQRAGQPSKIDFRGFRLIKMQGLTINEIKYMTKQQIGIELAQGVNLRENSVLITLSIVMD